VRHASTTRGAIKKGGRLTGIVKPLRCDSKVERGRAPTAGTQSCPALVVGGPSRPAREMLTHFSASLKSDIRRGKSEISAGGKSEVGSSKSAWYERRCLSAACVECCRLQPSTSDLAEPVAQLGGARRRIHRTRSAFEHVTPTVPRRGDTCQAAECSKGCRLQPSHFRLLRDAPASARRSRGRRTESGAPRSRLR
jgi:hypothetical protein